MIIWPALLGFVPAAEAVERPPCSLSGGAPRFSARRTRSIVRAAEVVVRARAVGSVAAPASARDPDHPYVAFVVLESMRGAALGDTLRFYGVLDTRDSFREPGEDRVPYLSYYRWRGGGNCSGMSYRPGGEYLLLVRRSERGEMDPYWTPLAPTSDQVRGRDDPWTVWVRREIVSRRRGSQGR